MHDPVARHLRDDRSARDAVAARVPRNDRGVWRTERAERATIDDQVIGSDREPRQRPSHREHGRVKNVHPVDLSHRRGADT